MVTPTRVQAAASPPLAVRREVYGRVELAIGRLGAGKTTWASLRAKRLAYETGAHRDPNDPQYDRPPGSYHGLWIGDGTHRRLVTTGQEWPAPWECVSSWDALFSVENAVVVLDEVHLIATSSRGLLSPDDEKRLLAWVSMLRKKHVCVIATTQAWTRVANQFRQLVGMCWVCSPKVPGRLHIANAHDLPEEGGKEIWSPQFFEPAAAGIPTNAGVWCPWAELWDPTPALADAAAAASPPSLRPGLPRRSFPATSHMQQVPSTNGDTHSAKL